MLERSHTFIGNAKNFKETKEKGLGLTIFISCILPFFRKSIGAGLNFILGECHVVYLKFLLLVKVYTVMNMFHVKQYNYNQPLDNNNLLCAKY